MKLGLAVPGGAFEHGGDLIVLEAFDVVKDKDHAVPGREHGDRAFERDTVYGTREHGVAGAEVALGRVFLGWVDGLFQGDKLETLFAQVHEDEVDGETVQPGGEGALATEAIELAKEMKEGLLGHVLGFGYVAQHAETEGVDTSLVKSVERGKGVSVALFGALDRFGFAGDWSIPLKEARVRFRLHSG